MKTKFKLHRLEVLEGGAFCVTLDSLALTKEEFIEILHKAKDGEVEVEL